MGLGQISTNPIIKSAGKRERTRTSTALPPPPTFNHPSPPNTSSTHARLFPLESNHAHHHGLSGSAPGTCPVAHCAPRFFAVHLHHVTTHDPPPTLAHHDPRCLDVKLSKEGRGPRCPQDGTKCHTGRRAATSREQG